MSKIAASMFFRVLCLDVFALAPCASGSFAETGLATGDACRKQICDTAVVGCMLTEQPLNPFARTAEEKKNYCTQFFGDCMARTVSPDLPWYSPEMVARFLKCPP